MNIAPYRHILVCLSALITVLMVQSCATPERRMVLYSLGNPEDFGASRLSLAQWFVEYPFDSVVIEDQVKIEEVHLGLTELSDTAYYNPRKLLVVFMLYENGKEMSRGAIAKLGWMAYNGHRIRDDDSAYKLITGCLDERRRDSLKVYVKHVW